MWCMRMYQKHGMGVIRENLLMPSPRYQATCLTSKMVMLMCILASRIETAEDMVSPR